MMSTTDKSFTAEVLPGQAKTPTLTQGTMGGTPIKLKNRRPIMISVSINGNPPRMMAKIGKFLMDSEFIYERETEADEPVIIAKMIKIVAVQRNIDDDRITLIIEFNTTDGVRRVELPRGRLIRQGILDLLSYGADVFEHKASAVLKFLNAQEAYAEHVLVHDRIGWGYWGGQKIYKHFRGIGCDSQYRGKLALEPKGSYTEWKALVEKEVLGNTPLELALVLGLSAAVVPLLSQETGLEVLLIHIFGDSTRGKTTATALAVSPFGYPHTRGEGLIKTWNGTRNSILGHFRNNHGVAMGLDEASMSASDDFTSFVYLLASGRDKSRLSKEGATQDSAEWSTTIISNAEISLGGRSSRNVGILMRLMEVGNLTWTRDATNSDTLKEGLQAHYGHAGPLLAAHLLALPEGKLQLIWRQWRDRLIDEVETKDQFTQRSANKLAIILATAEVARDALGLDFNLKEIVKLLLSVENQSVEGRDIGITAYNHFVEAFTRYRSKFSGTHFEETPVEHWGKMISEGGATKEIWILPNKFKEILKEGGFEDPKVVLQNWKQKGLLDCDKDGKNTRKRTLSPGLTQRVHVVKIREQDRPEELPSRAPCVQPAKVPKRKAAIDEAEELFKESAE